MDSVRSGNICRRFINGSCRFGRRCKYRHEFTPIPASQICRYFQKGGCWYGERCRFFHVLLPQVGPVFPGRRGSVPVASPSGMPHYSERRGSEPTLWRVNLSSRQRCSGSQSAIYPFNLQQETGHLPEYVLEELSQENYLESAPSSDIAQASAWEGRYERRASKSEMYEDGASAAYNEKSEETLAFLQSKNVVCGICMDKVYEKENQRDRVFGILPNCNHPFCLDCIATWRKTKDIGLDVVRACPQCRVRSAFYVPNKYWVEGQEKENVIGAFKKKFGKKRCCFYDRYGCCPFKKECLYRHVADSNSPVFSYLSEEEDDGFTDLLGFFISMSLLGGEEADEELLFCLTEDYGF
ncbi:PREDICTED: probable E3 ubiquitin-protein ligase makorin-1 isoform X1 [Poecilia mexicana]|uniref:RING-type E3 ubiquitin transferase n=1 Tax=Poecilia mexicana TaxID=48701 RepID=A0A3B3XAF8_9TELE|nr:PREDICTED: probable E3 ubiquitin-protein ligase makorin-1 isoform X1 [Poecilia mexicana]